MSTLRLIALGAALSLASVAAIAQGAAPQTTPPMEQGSSGSCSSKSTSGATS